MTLEENIKAILECNFSIAKEEVIKASARRIMEQISRQKNEPEGTMENTKLLEIFIDEITNIVPTDDKILLNSPKIEVETKACIPDRFVRKEIILSWVELKEDKK